MASRIKHRFPTGARLGRQDKAPSSKHQAPAKSQIPNSNSDKSRAGKIQISNPKTGPTTDHWDLRLGIFPARDLSELEFGVWDLGFRWTCQNHYRWSSLI